MDIGSIASTVIGTAGSVASGGVLGFVGSLISGFVKSKHISQQAKDALAEKNLDFEIAKSGHADDMAKIRAQSSASGLSASIQADAAVTNIHKWVADIKALYRPFITTVLVGTSVYIFRALVDGTMQQYFKPDEVTALIRYDVYTIIFMTGTALGWWFGERSQSPPHLK